VLGGQAGWPCVGTGLACLRKRFGPRRDGAGPPVHGGPRPGGSGARCGARPGHGGAPWPAPVSSPRRRYETRGATARARACSPRQGERDAHVYGDRKQLWRQVREAERLNGGDATTARACTRLRERGRTGREPADSSPQREARGVDLVAGDAAAAEIVGGGSSSTVRQRRRRC